MRFLPSCKGTPILFLIPLRTPTGKFRKKMQADGKLEAVEFLERYLITTAIEKNPYIINNKETRFLRQIHVVGVFNAKKEKALAHHNCSPWRFGSSKWQCRSNRATTTHEIVFMVFYFSARPRTRFGRRAAMGASMRYILTAAIHPMCEVVWSRCTRPAALVFLLIFFIF